MKHLSITLLSFAMLLSVGCIHKTGGTVTPWERATTDNAVFAQSINTVEQGTEATVTSGLLDKQNGANVLGFLQAAANDDAQITAILDKGGSVTLADYATIQVLIAQISASGQELVNSGGLGIKNPLTEQTISQDIAYVSNLASAVLTDVQALKGTN
jgi:hypothetical protein